MREILYHGLSVKVVKYKDDSDRDARFRWNVAKHDEEAQSCRWSTPWDKMKVPRMIYKHSGDWGQVRKELKTMYGKTAETRYGKWERAAHYMDEPVIDHLQVMTKVKQCFIFDNVYLMGSGVHARSKLCANNAKHVLDLLWSATRGNEDMKEKLFKEDICKPMKILEMWDTLCRKKHGSVCTASKAGLFPDRFDRFRLDRFNRSIRFDRFMLVGVIC